MLAGILISAAYYYIRDHQRIAQGEQDERRAKLQIERAQRLTERRKAVTV